MQKVLRCEWGFEIHADDDMGLVADVQRDALEAHGIPFSREEVLRLAFRAELDDRSWEQLLGSRLVDTS